MNAWGKRWLWLSSEAWVRGIQDDLSSSADAMETAWLRSPVARCPCPSSAGHLSVSLPVATLWGTSLWSLVRALAAAGAAVAGWSVPEEPSGGRRVGKRSSRPGRCPVAPPSPGKARPPPPCWWQALWGPVTHRADSPQLSLAGQALWLLPPAFPQGCCEARGVREPALRGTCSPQPCVKGDRVLEGPM